MFTAYLLEMYPRECCATIHTLRMTMVKGTFKDEVLVSTAGESEQYPAKEFAHALFKSGMLLEKRFIVIPVNLMYVIGEEKFGHSQVLLLDPSRKQSFFIDPMNDSFVRLSANAGKDPAQIFKESDMLIKLLQKHFFDPVPEFKNTFTRGIINATAAMLDVNKFFRVSRPHTVSPNYECPLAYYAVLPIILYWPLLSDAPAFQPAMERHPVRVLNALLHHFVCRSYSSSYPPKVSFIDHIFERMTVTPETAAQFLARPGTTEFDVECRSSTHAWKNFDSFIRVVVEGYMDPYAVRSIGAKPGVLTDLAQAKWFEPGFKVTPEERKVYEGKVKEFSVFLVQLLTDAVKRHRPDLSG